MRCMMHAAIVFLLVASVARAQSAMRPDQSVHTAARSLLTDDIPDCSVRPYSQLATFMNCNDCSPNLWNNYSSQRAAIVAHHSKHTDGKCGCLDPKNCVHGQATTPCGSHACRAEGHAERGATLNRYVASANCEQAGRPTYKTGSDLKLGSDKRRLTFSTLHIAPSPTCGAACSK